MTELYRLTFFGSGQLFGPQQKTIPVRNRKMIALLAYLAMERNVAHRRDFLLGLLWPELSTADARNNLRVTLTRVRRLFGEMSPPVLSADRQTVQFNAAAHVEVDVCEFQRHLETVHRHEHQSQGGCPNCLAALSNAVALYHAGFLQGFELEGCEAFGEWLLITREQLYMQAMDALIQLTAIYRAQQERKAEERVLRQWLALDPLQEEAHCALMELLAACGRRTDALAQFERCRQVLAAELGVPPSVETSALYERIRSAPGDDTSTADGIGRSSPKEAADATLATGEGPEARRHNLPRQLTPFIGRDEELEQLAMRLRTPTYRLITVTGPGGIGKSRLAQQAAAQQIDIYPDGVFFVSLAQIKSSESIPGAIADAVGLMFGGGQASPADQLVDMLRTRRVLLVLDNFEHLMDGVGLLLQLLQDVPNVVLLVTSRERLHVQIEDLFELPGLPVPMDAADPTARGAASVRLFVNRAHRLDKQFRLTDDVLPHIIRICRQVEGLPLAIELAATWVQEMSCAEIAAQLARGLGQLATTQRDVAEQHRSLGAVFDTSWALLTASEQSVLARLSAFRGGFTTAAAQDVAGASVMVMGSLRHKSLLRTVASRRYGMHELVHQMAGERLALTGARGDAHQVAVLGRHSRYYLRFIKTQAAALNGPNPRTALLEVRLELDNIRAAWHFAMARLATAESVWEHPDILVHLTDAVPGLMQFYRMAGLYREGASVFAQSLRDLAKHLPVDNVGVQRLRLQLQLAGGWMLVALGDLPDAIPTVQAAMSLAQTLGDGQSECNACVLMGYICGQSGEAERGLAFLERGLLLARLSGSRAQEGIVLRYLGTTLMDLEQRARAYDLLVQSLSIQEQVQNLNEQQAVALYLGVNAVEALNFQEARKYFALALALIQDTGNRSLEARIQNAVGFVTAALGSLDNAVPYHLRSRQIAREIGERIQESHALHNLCTVERKRGNLDEAEAYGQDALQLVAQDNLPEPTAYAWMHLGYVWAAQGKMDQALTGFTHAHEFWAQQDRYWLSVEALAGRAEAAFQLGQSARAKSDVDTVAGALLTSGPPRGVDEMFQIYQGCYRVLAAYQDPRADEVLHMAWAYLEETASAIRDPSLRHGFLNHIPAHRALYEAVNALPTPPSPS